VLCFPPSPTHVYLLFVRQLISPAHCAPDLQTDMKLQVTFSRGTADSGCTRRRRHFWQAWSAIGAMSTHAGQRLCKGNRRARTWSARGGAARYGLKLLVGGSTLGSASKPKFISNVNNAGDKYVEVQPWRYDRHGLYKAISQSVSPCQFN